MPLRMFKVKNPGLYAALKKMCGRVEVSSEGEGADYRAVRPTALDMEGEPPPPIWDVKGGERYITQCPFCRRFKLWVSYLAGCTLVQGDSRMQFSQSLVICYRCLFNQDYQRRSLFWTGLTKAGYTGTAKEVHEAGTGVVQYSHIDEEGPATMELPEHVRLTDPDCPTKVLDYLRGRGIDPADLSRCLSCVWSDRPLGPHRSSVGRLIFPIWQRHTLVGWQGRALDPEIKGTDIPKYYFPRGCLKERWLYNLDVARWSPVGVLVEGVLDVYKVGPSGVAQFGTVAGPHQVKLLRDIWGERAVVVVPDRDDEKAFDLARKEVNEWNIRGLFAKGAHLCITPDGVDPGGMEHSEIASLIKQQTGLDIQPKE